MEQGTRKLQSEAAGLVVAAPAHDGGSSLYVINLCASMTPIAQADKPIPGFESYRVYQVSRKEDGRVRYRLRLGFFADQAEAETALALIRDHYPTAFATSLSDDDQRHTRRFAPSATPTVVKAGPAPTPQRTNPTAAAPAATAPPAQSAKATPPPVKLSASESKPVAKAAETKAATPPAKVPEAKPAATKAQPRQAAQPATASDTQRVPALQADKLLEMELEWEEPAAPVATSAAPAPNSSQATPPVAAKAAPPKTVPTQAISAPAATKAPAPLKAELTLATETVAPASAAPARPATNEPFHVGKGVHIPTSDLSLAAESTPPAATPAAPEPKATAPVPPPAKPKAAQPASKAPVKPAVKIAPTKPAPVPEKPKTPAILDKDEPLPDFDSTQTIRALTPEELDDESQPKWFAAQLAVSEQPINLETMPQLDIFAAYRLYSIATAGSGKILHHMRIGFFKEQVSAEAVCGYLKTFFANATVMRISQAEYNRFADGPSLQPTADVKAKVIDITAARERTPPSRDVPVVTMEVVNPSTTGRFPKPNIEASGMYKRPAAQPAVKADKPAAAPKTATHGKTSVTSTGKHNALTVTGKHKAFTGTGKHKTLHQELLEEAREVELSESAIRRLPKNNSLLSKLFGKK